MESKKTILWLYYFFLGLMLISLSFSGYYMSVAQFGLVMVMLLDGMKKADYDDFRKRNNPAVRAIIFLPLGIWWILKSLKDKSREFFHRENAPAWIFASIYLFHVIGLLYTTDIDYALKDLRIKLPILVLPFVLSTTTLLDRKGFRFLIYIFCAAVFTGTLISTYHLYFSEFTDSREISRYISHIRFSLLIDMAIFILAYQVFKKNDLPRWPKLIMAAVALWMLLFLFLSAFMTGLVIFFITAALLISYMVLNRQGMVIKIAALAGVIALFVIMIIYIRNVGKDVNHIDPVDFTTLEKTTKLGNPYWHDFSNPQVENGGYVWLYVATDELREAWNKRSKYVFDGKDKAGQEIKYTLIRFLTSKGYRKDAEGVGKLTDQEVAMVEDGTASIIYVEKPNIYVRIYKIFWEYNSYQLTQNASGHSVMQRLVFWQTSLQIIREHWLTGVGTGDLEDAFQEEYTKSKTLLDKEFRWRSHNQFLAIFTTFGIIGLVWFLFSLVFPAARLSKYHDFYYLSFFIIVMMSMLTEDTLETQAGVTVFAFFNSFYLFAKKFIDIV